MLHNFDNLLFSIGIPERQVEEYEIYCRSFWQSFAVNYCRLQLFVVVVSCWLFLPAVMDCRGFLVVVSDWSRGLSLDFIVRSCRLLSPVTSFGLGLSSGDAIDCCRSSSAVV